MSRRRKIDSENVGERVSTSLRMPADLLERIDHVWKSSGRYTGRTHFIEAACNYYLDCKPCPHCGHMNSNSSIVCSICEGKLKPFQDCADLINDVLKIYDKSLKEISENIESYDNLFEKIGWLVDKLQSESQTSAKNIILSTMPSMERDIVVGRDFLTWYELYSKHDILPLPTPFAMLQAHKELFRPDHKSRIGIPHQSLAACVSTNYYYRTGQLVVQNPLSLQFHDLEDVLANLEKSMFHIESVAHDVMSALRYLQTVEKLTDILLQNP